MHPALLEDRYKNLTFGVEIFGMEAGLLPGMRRCDILPVTKKNFRRDLWNRIDLVFRWI